MIKDIGGKKINFEKTKIIPIVQSEIPKDIKGKLYVLEKLELDGGRRYFGFGYYIVGKKGKAKDKWTWGQFCPMGPLKDLKTITEKLNSL